MPYKKCPISDCCKVAIYILNHVEAVMGYRSPVHYINHTPINHCSNCKRACLVATDDNGDQIFAKVWVAPRRSKKIHEGQGGLFG